MKKLLLLISSIVFLGVVGCSSESDKLDTTILKTMGKNPDGESSSYVFPSYEILLDAVPFKAQLPVYVPIAGGTNNLWVPRTIVANSDLTEVSVSFSKEYLVEGIEQSGIFHLEISNYKDKFWVNHKNKELIKIDEKTNGYFYYLDSDSNHVDLRFSKDGIYYMFLYLTVEKSLEERKEELIKIANSMVDYDEWYDITF